MRAKSFYNQKTTDLSLFIKDLTTEQVGRICTWIKALRSGYYEQGKGALKRGNAYCCLGVANEVCNLGEPTLTSLTYTFDKMGLLTSGGVFSSNSLTGLNDGAGWSFNDIAQLLEDQLTVKGF